MLSHSHYKKICMTMFQCHVKTPFIQVQKRPSATPHVGAVVVDDVDVVDAVDVVDDVSMMTDASDFGCYYNHCIISIFIYYKNAYLSKSTKMDWMLGYFLPVRTSMYPSVSASC